ncbi:MAG: sulfotransferase family protein [Alphaproteobacteria bacterium]|nr:sulfotransferase family protein [Alphaproteobacteria bacterium]
MLRRQIAATLSYRADRLQPLRVHAFLTRKPSMIISHKYKFIFLRTEKTAGTSLTEALAVMLAPDDMIADMSRPGWAKFSPVHHGGLKRKLPQLFGLHVHATAAQAKAVIGAAKFNSYLKFAVERNPWDRQVSLYFQRKNKRGQGDDANFDRDMKSLLFRSTEYVRLNNWSIYTINNDIVADEIVRYEDLAGGLEKVFAHVGLKAALNMPSLRSGFRDDKDYRKHYSDATRERVARWYKREIDALGFVF